MLDLTVLGPFLAVILVFLAPPGPDMMYMLAVGLQGGRSAAVRAILGIGTGMSAYAAAAVLGLGSLAAHHPDALRVVKLGGALYLLWLCISTLWNLRASAHTADVNAAQRWYLRGLLVSLSNPKIILFFVAVLPRFVGHAQSFSGQLAMLGAVNVTTEVVLYGAIGVCASAFSGRFTERRGPTVVLNCVAAAVYLGLAIFIGVDALPAG